MKVDIARETSERALIVLAAALEGGKSATLKAYFAAMARFHNYSVRNLFLIMSARPDATKVAGFQMWKKLGRRVKRGEKGIAILAPIAYRKQVPDPEEDEKSDRSKEIANECLFGFKTAYVFDLGQTEGKPLPEFACVKGNPADHLDSLKRFVESNDINLTYSSAIGDAIGASYGGRIVIREGLAPAEEFSVLAHELAHERLHKDDSPRSRIVRETEAEAVAFVVCQAVGLDSTRASTDYIQLYKGGAKDLVASLERIRGAANSIITAITSECSRVVASCSTTVMRAA